MKIAILSTRDHCEYLREVLSVGIDECTFDFIEYNSMWELPGLYRGIWDKYDAFCTTGIFASEIITRTWEGRKKPLASIAAQSSEYYERYFYLLKENKGLDFNRIITDSQLWLDGTKGMVVLEQFNEPLIFNRSRIEVLKDAPLERIMMMDEIILENAKSLYRNEKIDMVICRSSTAAESLKESGIPYSFIFPKPDNVNQTINGLKTKVKIEEAKDSLAAVIIIRDVNIAGGKNPLINKNNINLLGKLLEYDKENDLGMLIQNTVRGIEIYTTKEKVLEIIGDHLNCGLQSLFNNNLHIGYGINKEFYSAKHLAIEAIRHAKDVGESYLMNEKNHLIKLSGKGNSKGSVERLDIIRISKESNLSVDTIQNIIYTMEELSTNELTTRDLSSTLDMTTANANRILNTLVNTGLAETDTFKQIGIRGRPSKIYRINFSKDVSN